LRAATRRVAKGDELVPALRAFFAIELAGALRERTAELARELSARPGGDGVRWVAPGGYHLTLRFLGNVAAAELEPLAEHAQDALAPFAPFALTLGAPVAFPSPRRPKVVALPAQPESALSALAEELERVAVAHGLPPEERALRPHLTLGRVRARRVPALEAPPPAGSLDVRGIVLFRSDLAPDGAHYTPLATLALGAPRRAAAHAHSPSSI
jgi:2'-5' RNA ligase